VSSSQIFAAEALLRSVHEMAESFALNASARELPLIHADPYLNNLLLKYCEAAITDRRGNVSQLRTRVENAISSLLPHGRVVVDDVARSPGMNKRTLGRRLSDEGLNFTEVLQQLRRNLAVRYLDDPKLHISKIAWLLGFNEVSAFTHHSSGGPERRRARCVSEEQVRHKTGGHLPHAMASPSGEC
jgi:AraC-like DNA-binding protein